MRLLTLALFLITLQTPLIQTDVGAIDSIAHLTTDAQLLDVAWSPDGQTIAVGSSLGVMLYDSELRHSDVLEGHTGNVAAVAWKPDGSQLASAGGVGDAGIRIWNRNPMTEEFTLIRTLLSDTQRDFYYVLSWSPDETKLAALAIFNPYLRNEAFGTIEIWDTSTWVLQKRLNGLSGYINPAPYLGWSADSNYLAGSGEEDEGFDSLAYVKNVVDGENIIEFSFVEPMSVALSSDGRIAITRPYLAIYNVTTGQFINSLEIVPGQMIWSPDNSKIIGMSSSGLARIINVSTMTIVAEFSGPNHARDIDWSPAGTKIVIISFDGAIEVRNMPTFEPNPTPEVTSTMRP